MAAVTPPRGMRDFLPREKAHRESLLAQIRQVYRAHGFDEIETPVVEDADRLHAGLGGDNEKLAFAVMRRGLSRADLEKAAAADDPLQLADLGLRFDLTVPLARFYASHRAELPAVFRSIQIAPVWRAERPQKGRYRQFVQCDIDIIGESGVLAELELIQATAEVFRSLGIDGARVRINDRRILGGLLTHWQVTADRHGEALIILDKLDKIGAEGVASEFLAAQLAPGFASVDQLVAALHAISRLGWGEASLPAGIDPHVYAELEAIRAALPQVALELDVMLVRGMGYYTATIFEIAHPEFGYSLGGGGRYDGMIGQFLGFDVPACGFSIGFERIVELVAQSGAGEDRVAVLLAKGTPPAEALSLKRDLMARGHQVRLETRANNERAQFERLLAEGFRQVAFAAPGVPADQLTFRALG